MSSKVTKAPVMKKDQQYIDWKKELQIWQCTNEVLKIDKKLLAGVLFESLEGIARQTVLSELSVSEISHENGVEKIIETLDEYFIGNETQNAFNAMEELLQYKCEKGTSMENFLVDFNIIVKKVKASGTVVSDRILGFALLNAADLSDDKHAMIKATCVEPTYKVVKRQLEKIGFAKSSSKKSTNSHDGETSKVKVESCFYNNTHYKRQYAQDGDSSRSSSDEDLNGEKVYYSQRKTSFSGQGMNTMNSKYKKNPLDRFGNVRSCSFCQCLYHWLVDCPYAPIECKSNLKHKEKFVKSYNKPL